MSKQDSPQVRAIRARYQQSFSDKASELGALQSALLEGRGENPESELNEYLHKLAGSSGMYGYSDLSQVCREAMAAIESGNDTNLARSLEQVQALLTEYA